MHFFFPIGFFKRPVVLPEVLITKRTMSVRDNVWPEMRFSYSTTTANENSIACESVAV